MIIRFTNNQQNEPLSLSTSIVSEFIKDNPRSENLDIRTRELAARLLNKLPPSTVSNTEVEIVLANEDFPEDMRAWAIAKKSLTLIEGHPIETPYSFLNIEWGSVEIVVQAKEGVRGAWFFSNHQKGSVVVKAQEGADLQLMGTVLLRQMGLNAPDCRIIPRDSAEGIEIAALGEGRGLNQRPFTHYLVIDRVYGPTFTNLTSSETDIEMLRNNLERIGELLIYDLLIGNYDRFQLDSTSFNSGNLMFQDGVVYAIDSDCVFQEDRADFTKLAFRKINSGTGDYDNKIAIKLARNLGPGITPETIDSQQIQKGMVRAFQKLQQIAQHRDLDKRKFIESCEERGLQMTDFPEHVRDLLNYINSLKRNNL